MQKGYRRWSLQAAKLHHIPRQCSCNRVSKLLAQVRPFHVAVPVISLLRSNKKQINWDQLDKEVSAELEGEKLEGDAALNKLFKDIYDRADEVCMPLIHSVTAYTL